MHGVTTASIKTNPQTLHMIRQQENASGWSSRRSFHSASLLLCTSKAQLMYRKVFLTKISVCLNTFPYHKEYGLTDGYSDSVVLWMRN